MVDVYNQKAANSGVAEKMIGLWVDVLSIPSDEIPNELQNVDVVVCSMSFHHIEDISLVSKVLASFLKRGGHLLVADLLQSFPPSVLTLIVDEVSNKFHSAHHGTHMEGHSHGQNHGHSEHLDGHTKQSVIDTVPHIGGLSKEGLEDALNSTGLLEDVVAEEAFTHEKEGTSFKFVLVRGKRR